MSLPGQGSTLATGSGWLLKWEGWLGTPQGSFGPPLRVNTSARPLARPSDIQKLRKLNIVTHLAANKFELLWVANHGPDLHKIICRLFIPPWVTVLTCRC